MVEVRTIAVMGATGCQGRGVIDALLFTLSQSSVQYDVRAMTRCHSSTLAREFKRDYPQLSLIQWHEEDTESIRRCFDGCYGVFINTGVSPSPKATIQELTRTEIALGKRCLEAAEAAKVSHMIYPTFASIFNASDGRINVRRFETKYQISLEIQSSSIKSTILCPGPFYTDFQNPQYAYWEGSTVVFSTPAAPGKSMGFADPGHDIGWFAKAAFDEGPDYRKGQVLPVCGRSISYSELAGKFSAVTGIKAEYRQCGIEEFEARFGRHLTLDKRDMGELGKWLAIAPDNMTCYGTIEMERLYAVESDLRVKALTWEAFLMRTAWMGPPR